MKARQKRIRITVKKICVHHDLIALFENPIKHACHLKEGDVFEIDGFIKPENFCDAAWESIAPFVEKLANGEGNFYDGWMKNKYSAMISCNDGFRPVSFYIEVIDEDNK